MTGRVLLVATPLLGHLGPLLSVGRGLRRAGHEVEVLTGSAMRGLVDLAGLGFAPLPEAAVGRPSDGPVARWSPPWAAARREVIDRFVRPLRRQADALGAVLADGSHAVVVADTAYLGTLPLLLDAGARPPVIGVSVTPLSHVSSGASPFGSGLPHRDSRFARERNRQVNWLLHRGPLRPIQDALHEALTPWRVPAGTINYFDAAAAFDQTFQLGVPELEYPRAGLPDRVRCVGPVPPVTPARGRPSWWPEFTRLARDRPVVHVTQGTVDNHDLDRLIGPALRSLADREAVVVVTTGAGPGTERTERVGSATVFVTGVVGYADLLPRTDLMITNGGWGGVQQAAVHGVPMIVAGSTQEKPEVAARVAWSGLGLDLRTGSPGVARLRRAVGQVLDDGRCRDRAAAVRARVLDRPDPLALVVAEIERAAGLGPERGQRTLGSRPAVRSSTAGAPVGTAGRARR